MFLQKSVIAAAGLMLASSSLALAQQPRTSTPRAPDAVQRKDGSRPMKGSRHGMRPGRFGFGLRGLNLTDEQRQQTRAILQRHLDNTRSQREELLKLREKRITETFTAEDRARAKALHQELRGSMRGIRDEIGNVLTSEQRTQLEQFESQRKARREEMLKRRLELRDRIPQ